MRPYYKIEMLVCLDNVNFIITRLNVPYTTKLNDIVDVNTYLSSVGINTINYAISLLDCNTYDISNITLDEVTMIIDACRTSINIEIDAHVCLLIKLLVLVFRQISKLLFTQRRAPGTPRVYYSTMELLEI